MRAARVRGVLLTVLFVLPVEGFGQSLNPALKLSVDTPFAVLGGISTFTLTGPPDLQFQLWASLTPAETFVAGWGTTFLSLNNRIRVGQGNLSAAGVATVSVPVSSSPDNINQIWYFQAKAWGLRAQGVSEGSLSLRIVSSAPTGVRRPEALAVTSDGARAFVANQADGTVQFLDAVHDVLLGEIPVAPPPASVGRSIEAAIDPEGRHLFVVNPQMPQVSVIHTATGSVAAQIPVPKSSRDVAFDFSGIDKKIYITSERDEAVLVFKEAPPGTFTRLDNLALQGRGPGPIGVLPSGLLMIGHGVTHEVEVIDPLVAGGATVARTPLNGVPNDILISGSRAIVPSFSVPDVDGAGDGDNVVFVVDLSSFQVTTAVGLANLGTDYFAATAADPLLAVLGSGSGSVLLADTSTLSLLQRIDLAPGEPTTDPSDAAFVPAAAPAQKLYVVNHLRETVRPIDVSSGPPFTLLPEIPLARSGRARVPGVDLTPLENGEWLYATVEFFNGTALNPNRVTCNTCHPRTFAGGLKHPNIASGKQAQPMFDVGSTGPWLWDGTALDLLAKTKALFTFHGTVGGTLRPGVAQSVVDFQRSGTKVPVSPFLEPGGLLSTAAQRGKTVFEGKANCSSCHTAPLFIPVSPQPLTISQGVGVGQAPDNVPSLRGLWSSAPYLWNGAAATLRDVIVNNPGDAHGTTSTLTEQEVEDLIEFLKTL